VIVEALQADTMEDVLFAKWAFERNARVLGNAFREVGRRSEAGTLLLREAVLREMRVRLLRVIIEFVEERMPSLGP